MPGDVFHLCFGFVYCDCLLSAAGSDWLLKRGIDFCTD